MKSKDITTTDLTDFGSRERKMLLNILESWHEHGLPEGFYHEEVRAMMNKNSGYVFLTNSEYQTAMLNGDKLEIWFNCPNFGHEGFEEDCDIDEDKCNECRGK